MGPKVVMGVNLMQLFINLLIYGLITDTVSSPD